MTTAERLNVSTEGSRPSECVVGPMFRSWQRLYRGTVNFRGKGRILFDWPSRIIRKWPTDVSITSREGCVFLHCDLNEYLYRYLYFFGLHEIDVDWMCRRLLRPADVFIDIGACYGYHALTAAHRVGPEGRVYAIEPQPEVFAALQLNARRNGNTNIEMDNLALSDRAEWIELHRFADLGVGHTSISQMEHHVSQVHCCRAITLDEYIAERSIGAVALAKLDVEGAEQKILKGAQAMLSGPNPPMWVLEVNVETAQACGYQPRDLLSFLAEWGYQAYRPVWGDAVREVRRVEFCPADQIEHGQNLLCAIPSLHAGALVRVGIG